MINQQRKEIQMAYIINIYDREEIPDHCTKVGETFCEGIPEGHLAEVLNDEPVIWLLREALLDKYGAFRVWCSSYYIPAPE